jgi:ferredoxin
LDCPVHAIISMGEHRPSSDGAAHREVRDSPEPDPNTEGSEAISEFVR